MHFFNIKIGLNPTLIGLIFVGLTSCITPVVKTELYFPPEAPAGQSNRLSGPLNNSCTNWRNYIPDTALLPYQSTRVIRVNFHVLNSRDSSQNFKPQAAKVYLRALLEYANAELDTNIRNWRSPEGTPVLPKGYRYAIQPQAGDDGFYFHFDDTLYYFISQGKYQNNYSRKVVDKYAVGKDSILNIFLLVHHPDSVLSKTYRTNGQGIALGNSLKMAGLFESKEPAKSFDGLLNHEIGHILGIQHAWVEDGCPDTENHPNKCWGWTPEPPCRDQATNNMMDYNAYQIALTPCQLGRIHAGFATEGSAIRKCLEPVWCRRNPDMDMVIRDSVAWSGARDLEGHITVAPGGRLYLSCRVSMPAGSRLTVQPGGILYLDGARLHNACGLNWRGIIIESNKSGKGKVVTYKTPKIENCRAILKK